MSNTLLSLTRRRPTAAAYLSGAPANPEIKGAVLFYQTSRGVLVTAEISGLPKSDSPAGHCGIFGFHIHDGGSCTGNGTDPFADTGSHYNPSGAPHPCHAGDLPPLFSADGVAFSAVLTNRFSTSEIIGKTVIIHSHPDDFTTQPSGNAGTKIACGTIKSY